MATSVPDVILAVFLLVVFVVLRAVSASPLTVSTSSAGGRQTSQARVTHGRGGFFQSLVCSILILLLTSAPSILVFTTPILVILILHIGYPDVISSEKKEKFIWITLQTL